MKTENYSDNLDETGKVLFLRISSNEIPATTIRSIQFILHPGSL